MASKRRYWSGLSLDHKIENTEEVRKLIKRKLAENNFTQKWLLCKLEKIGVVCDKTELSSILNGSRHGDKVDTVLTLSIDILSKYEDNNDNFTTN